MSLSEEEVEDALSSLRAELLTSNRKCLKHAKQIVAELANSLECVEMSKELRLLAILEVTSSLFNKRARKAFTALRERLDQKVYKVKNGEGTYAPDDPEHDEDTTFGNRG